MGFSKTLTCYIIFLSMYETDQIDNSNIFQFYNLCSWANRLVLGKHTTQKAIHPAFLHLPVSKKKNPERILRFISHCVPNENKIVKIIVNNHQKIQSEKRLLVEQIQNNYWGGKKNERKKTLNTGKEPI